MSAKQDVAKPENAPALLPPIDVVEDESGITVTADLPGVPRDRLSVRVDGDTLTVEGELALDVPAGMEAAYVEVRAPRYRRSFTLSRELDATKVEASLMEGVVRLRIPKIETAKPRRIEVKVA